MSIRDVINRCLADGSLHILPHALGAPPVRTMLVSDEVLRFVCGPWDSIGDEIRAGRLWQCLDQFTEGRIISIARHPYRKPRSAYLAPLDPVADRIFDIRNRDKPAIRLLGGFAEQDVFIALVWDYRERLGGPDSRAWRDLRERAKAEWRWRLHPWPPISGADPNDLATRILPV